MNNKTNKIRIVIIAIFCLMLVSEYTGAEHINQSLKQENDIDSYLLTFSENDFQFNNIREYTTITYEDNGQLNEVGNPMMPIKHLMVALPENIRATNIRIINQQNVMINGKYNIFPSQSFQKLNNIFDSEKIQKNNRIYNSYVRYPSKSIELINQVDLAGQSIAIINVYPLHYFPKLNLLELTSKIEFSIEGINGYYCEDYLPNKISKNLEEMYETTIKEMVINPEDVILQKNPNSKPVSIDSGDYDYVIITNNSWINAFQPLIDWKIQKGVPSKIVTTDWIYNNENYSGSEKEKIRSFIEDAHINWGSGYFLLGGDSDYIPYHSAYILGDNIPSDTYYSDYDDDWVCEVHIGRASVNQIGNGAGGIGTFVNKSLNYEKNPPLSNFSKNISLFGFDLDAITDGEDCKIDIDDLYIPSNWTIAEVYDSHSGNHEDNVDLAVNKGQNLINHIDHSNYNYMGTGYTNHDWGLTNSEVDAFSNGEKQSTWYSIGCWSCAYDYDNCIAEHFVRDTNGGGIAFIGNSRYGWYQQGSDDGASLRYDRYFFKSFFDENHYRLGDIFSDHKVDAFNSMYQNDYNKYIFTELTLLGDPELPLWKENPLELEVTCPDSLPLENSSFKVHVENSTGDNIYNAYVCLLKKDEVYLTGYTDGTGNITFNTSPLTLGWMNITVTKQNHIPFEGESEVVLSNYPPYQPFDPFPEDGSTGVSINASLLWDGGDPDGDPVTYDVYFGTSSPPPLEIENITIKNYNPGTMDYNTTYYWKIVAWDNSSESNESEIWSFTTEKLTNNPPYPASNPSPENGSIDVDTEVDISWTGGDPDGDSVTYDIFFGEYTSPPKIVNNQTNDSYDLGILSLNTTYYWYIITWDTQGNSTKGPIWCFTTAPNSPPSTPEISGPDSGSIGVIYNYKFISIDPDGHVVFFYIKWGDGEEEWIGPYSSGEEVEISHTWDEIGSYVISAKAKDEFEANSNWGTLEITMPKNKLLFIGLEFINKLIERFPNVFPILNQLIKLL